MGPKRRRLRWGWIGAAVAVLSAGGVAAWQQNRSAAKAAELPKGVQVAQASRGEIEQKITATGIVAAQIGAKVNIGSEITGRIRRLPADVGARVVRNQVIAELDSPDLVAQVEQQQQNVSVAEASLAQAESRLRQASLNLELSKEQTRAQIDEAEFALKSAEQRLEMARASAKLQPTQTSSEIARAEAALSTARSHENQVKQTVRLDLLRAQTSIDEARAEMENAQALLRRQQRLLSQGFISPQEVDDTRKQHRQAAARFQSAEANLEIVREKTAADLQAARDQILQAQATLNSASAGRLQDTMREAEMRSAREAVRQANAVRALRRSNRTGDRVKLRAVEEARAAVAQARANLRQARAQLEYQQARLDKTVIRTPIDGTVLTITAQQGETIAAGLSAPTLVTVADLNRLEVRAYVDETDIGRVRLGLPAEVRVESHRDQVFRGRVTKIASASTIKDNVVTYETTVALDNPGGLLRPDMTADVTLILGRRSGLLVVPSEAVHREVGRAVVYVLHPEKQGAERVETRSVQIGADDGTETEIRSGLREGEQVVLAGLQRLGVQAIDSQTQTGRAERRR